jgi:hypothetical protein
MKKVLITTKSKNFGISSPDNVNGEMVVVVLILLCLWSGLFPQN